MTLSMRDRVNREKGRKKEKYMEQYQFIGI